MSIPSASCAVQIGVMAFKAADTSFQDRPAMLPESSIRKMVSKSERKAYGSSGASLYGGGADVGTHLLLGNSVGNVAERLSLSSLLGRLMPRSRE